MKRKTLFTLLLVFIAINMFAIKIEINKEGPQIIDTTYNEDYIFMGQSLAYNSWVKDLVFAGAKFTFDGKSEDSVYSVGEDLRINGVIGNDLIIIGESISIDSEIKSNLFMAGENIIVSKYTKIGDSVFAAGKYIEINCNVAGDIRVGGGTIVLNGVIDGDVYAASRNAITLGQNAMVNGNFIYTSQKELDTLAADKIKGDIVFKENRKFFHNFEDSKEKINKGVSKAGIIFKVFIAISFLIAGLLLLLFPGMSVFDKKGNDNGFLTDTAWGLIPFFLYFAAIIISIIFIITIPIGLMMALMIAPVLIITQMIGMVLTGRYLFETAFKTQNSRFLYFLFGFFIALITSFIPVLNVIAVIFLSSAGWGFIIKNLISKNNNNEIDVQPVI